MAASLLLLMVPNGLRANAEQATETTDATEATIEETQSDENAEEVTNEADDFTYDENNEAIENGKEYIAEESSQPNFEDFAINIEIDGTGSFYGEITSLYSGAEWLYPSTNPQTSATDPYPEIIAEMGDDIYFDEDWSCFSIDENNHLVWMYFTDSDYYSGDIIPTTIEGKTPVWYCGSTKITEDDTYFNDQSYTFTLVYEGEDPGNVTVTVDLDGGEITATESAQLAEAEWSLESDGTWTHEFESGTYTEAQAMSAWNAIEPTKGTSTFKAWDPVPGTTSVTADKTFTATYEEEPAEILNVKIDATEGTFSGVGEDAYSYLEEYDIDRGTTTFTDPYLSDTTSYAHEPDESFDGFAVDEDNVLKYSYYLYVNEYDDYACVIWTINAAKITGKVPVWTVNGEVLEPGETCGFVADTMNTVSLSYAEPSVFHTVTVDITAEGKLTVAPDPTWNKVEGENKYTKDFAENSDLYNIIWNDFRLHPTSTSEYYHYFDYWDWEEGLEKLTKPVTFTAMFVSKMKPSVNISTTGPSADKQGTFDFYVDVDDTTIIDDTNKTSSTDTIIKEYFWNEYDCFTVDEDGVITYIYWFVDEYSDEHTCEGTIYPDKTMDFQFVSWTLNGQSIAYDGDYHYFKDYIVRGADGKIPQFPEFNFVGTFEESSTFTIEGRVTKDHGGNLPNVDVSFVVDGEIVASDVTDDLGWYVLDISKEYMSGGIVNVDPGEATAFYPPCATSKEYVDITEDLHYEHFKLAQGNLVYIDPVTTTQEGHQSFDYKYIHDGQVVSEKEFDNTAIGLVPGTTYQVVDDRLIFSLVTDTSNSLNTYVVTPVPEDGYVFDKWFVNGDEIIPEAPSGTIEGYDGIEFTVSYREAGTYNLTINYINDEGMPLENPYAEALFEGEVYNVKSPVIEGYVLADPNQEYVFGTMPNTDVVVNVVYNPVTAEEIIDNTSGNAQTGDNNAVPFAIIGIVALASVCFLANRKATLNR